MQYVKVHSNFQEPLETVFSFGFQSLIPGRCLIIIIITFNNLYDYF